MGKDMKYMVYHITSNLYQVYAGNHSEYMTDLGYFKCNCHHYDIDNCPVHDPENSFAIFAKEQEISKMEAMLV